ncbi:MAG TPA: aminotransferase class V-fold PLP-dependent enzyme [Desulfobacterales bacterium]|nr:aminotransferase class V-fold PLP-dependent enzyme [Desulfobacterales bacterium]
MNGYFEWASDLYVPCMKRFQEAQERGIDVQNTYTLDPKENWNRLWEYCEAARCSICRLIGARQEEKIVLTQGTMDGLLRVFDALMRDPARPLLPGDTVVTSDCEFAPIYPQFYPLFDMRIAKIHGCRTEDELLRAILGALATADGPVKLLLLSHVLYREGVRLPLEVIIPAVRNIAPDTTIVIDGAQALGQIHVDMMELNVDFYVGDFHKWIQGPNFTGFIHCRDNRHLQSLLQYTVHPMAFARSFGIEGKLCSKFGPLPFAFAGLPTAIQDFLTGDLKVDSFQLTDRLRSRISESALFSKALEFLAPDALRTGMIALPIEPSQAGLRWRLFKNYGVLVSEHNPEIVNGLKRQIYAPRFIRISCSDNWNTEEEVDYLFEILGKEWCNMQ